MDRKRRKKRRGKGSRTSIMEKIARERMEILYTEAGKRSFEGRIELAQSYMRRAKRIGKRLNQRMPRKYRGKYCKKCLVPFSSSDLFQVRLRRGRRVTTCKNCGNISRIPLAKTRSRQTRIEINDTFQ